MATLFRRTGINPREVFAATAAMHRAQYVGRNLRVRRSSVVHAVGLSRWVGDGEETQVPGPLCHTGVGGWDLLAMAPTDDAVTCQRCRRSNSGHETPLREQLALFDLG